MEGGWIILYILFVKEKKSNMSAFKNSTADRFCNSKIITFEKVVQSFIYRGGIRYTRINA